MSECLDRSISQVTEFTPCKPSLQELKHSINQAHAWGYSEAISLKSCVLHI